MPKLEIYSFDLFTLIFKKNAWSKWTRIEMLKKYPDFLTEIINFKIANVINQCKLWIINKFWPIDPSDNNNWFSWNLGADNTKCFHRHSTTPIHDRNERMTDGERCLCVCDAIMLQMEYSMDPNRRDSILERSQTSCQVPVSRNPERLQSVQNSNRNGKCPIVLILWMFSLNSSQYLRCLTVNQVPSRKNRLHLTEIKISNWFSLIPWQMIWKWSFIEATISYCLPQKITFDKMKSLTHCTQSM